MSRIYGVKFLALTGSLLSAFLLIAAPSILAGDCGAENVALSVHSQAEVDAFQSTNGGGGVCDRVLGPFSIRGDDIVDLSPLSDLEVIGRSLTIENNAQLGSVNGLSGIRSVGGALLIRNNAILQNLDGLSGLTSVGYDSYDEQLWDCWTIMIRENSGLLNIDGLSQLTSTTCDIRIRENPSLQNLDGLSGMTSVGGSLEISGNTSLQNVDGLSSLTDVGSGTVVSIEIADSQITNVDALSSIQWADDLYLYDNHLLADCRGVISLIDPIDDYQPGPGNGPAPDLRLSDSIWNIGHIERNALGCNSTDEILATEPLTGANAGLNEAWFNPDTDGQGFFITIYPKTRVMFVSWFTFDVERPDNDVTAQLGDPGHRWLTAQGEYGLTEMPVTLDVWVTKGGVFNSPIPETSTEPDGEMTLEFETCNKANLTFDIPSIGATGTMPIERLALDNIRHCYELEKMLFGEPRTVD